jgi:hypothetical protein
MVLDMDAEILALMASIGEVDKDTTIDVQDYLDAGEHGLALGNLVAWTIRNHLTTELVARLERLVAIGGFPEDLERLRKYALAHRDSRP